jgi:prolyl 4-hydroxylase
MSCAFAGGGFGANSLKGTKKKKTKKRGLESLTMPSKKPEEKEKEPQLDKWGLPAPTTEDIFPLMPPGTDLRPATKDDYSLSEMKEFLKNHIAMQLDHFFDENGVEKRQSSSQAPPMKLVLLHESPPVFVIENFFTPEQCLQVDEVAMPTDNKKENSSPQHAVQVNSATFSPLAQSKRTSTSWFCHYAQVPVLLTKASHVLSIPLEHMEEPQIVRYKTGQEFSWHCDEVPSPQLSNGGQRLATLLVYLNTVETGGGTEFRDLRDAAGNPLSVQPRQGSALLFFPAYRDGKPDERTLHKGEIAETEKRIVQMWIHERNYRAVLPPGNSQQDAIEAVEQTSRALGYSE